MSTDQAGGERVEPFIPRVKPGDFRVRDFRLRWKMELPPYFFDWVPRLGDTAALIYVLLCRAATLEGKERWPSVRSMAAAVGKSRSSAERALRLLRELGFIVTPPCIDENGQKSNYFDLHDPFELREQTGSLGTPVAGAGNGDGGAPSPMTPPPFAHDGGAPSPMTAPPFKIEELKGVCAEEDTHTPSAARREEEALLSVAILAAQWCAQLPPGAPGRRPTHEAEVRWYVQELLAAGWTEGELSASINDPQRDRGEYPRVWAARHSPAALKAARKPAEAARARLAQAQTLAAAREEGDRRASRKAAFDRLPQERQAEILGRLATERPELRSRPGILRLLAEDAASAEAGQLDQAEGQ